MTAPTPELTRNPVDGSWGFICTEHGIHRHGLGEQHARNVEAKHLREDHADPLAVTLDLKALAQYVWDHAFQSPRLWSAWQAFTGMDEQDALRFAEELVESEPVTLAVAPF